MTPVSFLHRLRLTWELNRSLKQRKLARPARQKAAQQGQHTEWKRRGERCREVFG